MYDVALFTPCNDSLNRGRHQSCKQSHHPNLDQTKPSLDPPSGGVPLLCEQWIEQNGQGLANTRGSFRNSLQNFQSQVRQSATRRNFVFARSLGGTTKSSCNATRRITILLAALLAPLLVAGCVRRTMTITTDPPDARVFLNEQEIGRSKVTTDFLWYGDYDVAIRKDGYQTLQTNWKVEAPWYQVVPLDFFFESLWPAELHDEHERHFTLEPQQIPTSAELIERANETRELALDARK